MPVTIQNGDIRRKISEDIRATNPSLISNLLTDYNVPVLLINDGVYFADDSFTESGIAINATDQTVFTTDSIKDTYITGVTLSMIKDVTATSTLTSLTVVKNGQTKRIASIASITLTVQESTISCSFYPPVKVDRSSIVNVNNSTAVGNIKAVACVSGFLRLRS